MEQDFENQIDRKNSNNKQVGQIISSIKNIYQTCLILQQLQNKNKTLAQLDKDDTDERQMVKNLQSMLDEAKSRMVELTQVLTHLKDEYDPEAYYEKAAEKAMEPMLGHSSAAAAASNYGGGGGGG